MGMFSVTNGSFEGLNEGRELKHRYNHVTFSNSYSASVRLRNVVPQEEKVASTCAHSEKTKFQVVYVPDKNDVRFEWAWNSYRCNCCGEIVQDKIRIKK